MATSGTYIFNPDLAEMVDEACERCRIDPAKITSRHILSARRSMRFMLAHWATQNYEEFRISETTLTLTDGQSSYVAGTDFDTDQAMLDIIDVSLRRSGIDTPVTFMSRSQYLDIPEKTVEGRPDRVFIDKQRDGITMTLWPVPENSTDILVFNAVRKYQDSDTAADNADIPYYMYDAFAYGLAFRLCEKFGTPELEAALYAKAERSFNDGTSATREPGDVIMKPCYGRRRARSR